MTVFSSNTIQAANIKLRFTEPFLTFGINQKMLGTMLPGVYRGFIARPQNPAGTGIILDVDPVTGDSIAVLEDYAGGAPVLGEQNGVSTTIHLRAQQVVDGSALFSPTKAGTYWVVLDVDYRLKTPTSGTIQIVDASELSARPRLVRVCQFTLGALDTAITTLQQVLQAPPVPAGNNLAATFEVNQVITTRPWSTDTYHGFLYPDAHQRLLTHPERNALNLGTLSQEKYGVLGLPFDGPPDANPNRFVDERYIQLSVPSFGQRLITVGPPGSGANFEDTGGTGTGHIPFVNALAALAARSPSGGTIYVLPGSYDFGALVTITQANVTIVGLNRSAGGSPSTVLRISAGTQAGFPNGGFFFANNVGNVCFENLEFLESRAVDVPNAMLAWQSAVVNQDGGRVRDCLFTMNAHTFVAIDAFTAASGSTNRCISDFRVEYCRFAGPNRGSCVALSDCIDWRITDCTYDDSTTPVQSYRFTVGFQFYMGKQNGRFSRNRVVGNFAPTGGALDIGYSDNNDESLVEITESLFQSTNTVDCTDPLLKMLDTISPLSPGSNTTIVRDNMFDCRPGHTTAIGSQGLGILRICGNTIGVPVKPAMAIEAAQYEIDGNSFETGPIGFFNTATASSVRFSGNNVTIDAGPGPFYFPTNATIVGNRFQTNTPLAIRTSTNFSDNYVQAGGAVSSALGLNDAVTASDITISGNSAFLGGATMDFIVGRGVPCENIAITGNTVQNCRAFVNFTAGPVPISDSTITENNIINCTVGFAIPSSTNVIVSNNTVNYNNSFDQPGILGINAGASCLVEGNLFSNLLATAADGADRIVIRTTGDDCVVSNNVIRGMSNVNIGIACLGNGVTISGNIVDNLGNFNNQAVTDSRIKGIYATGLATITGNTISTLLNAPPNLGRGIHHPGFSQAPITGNNLSLISGEGIVGNALDKIYGNVIDITPTVAVTPLTTITRRINPTLATFENTGTYPNYVASIVNDPLTFVGNYNTFEVGIGNAVPSQSHFFWKMEIPQGATIIDATLTVATTAANTSRFVIARVPSNSFGGSAALSLVSTGYLNIGHFFPTPVDVAITANQNNVVDTTSYSYYVVLQVDAAAGVYVYGIKFTYGNVEVPLL